MTETTEIKAKELLRFSALAAIVFVSIAVLFRTAFAEIWKAWQTEEYSHGYLVPVIGIILLLKWTERVQPQRQNSWFGFAGVVIGLLCLFLFTLAGMNGVMPLLFLVFLMAVIMAFNGFRYMTAFAAPLGFLVFLTPLPKFLYYTLSFNMQMISTDLSVAMLKLIGVSVFQEGNVIDLGIIRLEVAEACNGLRYLFPLMALGYLLALLYQAPIWKRIFLFLSTVPVTIALNSLRIVFIGLSAHWWGGGRRIGDRA